MNTKLWLTSNCLQDIHMENNTDGICGPIFPIELLSLYNMVSKQQHFSFETKVTYRIFINNLYLYNVECGSYL